MKVVPCVVDFGMDNVKQAREIIKISDGVIGGSAIVKIIKKYGDNANEELFKYIRRMKSTIKNEI